MLHCIILEQQSSVDVDSMLSCMMWVCSSCIWPALNLFIRARWTFILWVCIIREARLQGLCSHKVSQQRSGRVCVSSNIWQSMGIELCVTVPFHVELTVTITRVIKKSQINHTEEIPKDFWFCTLHVYLLFLSVCFVFLYLFWKLVKHHCHGINCSR